MVFDIYNRLVAILYLQPISRLLVIRNKVNGSVHFGSRTTYRGKQAIWVVRKGGEKKNGQPTEGNDPSGLSERLKKRKTDNLQRKTSRLGCPKSWKDSFLFVLPIVLCSILAIAIDYESPQANESDHTDCQIESVVSKEAVLRQTREYNIANDNTQHTYHGS